MTLLPRRWKYAALVRTSMQDAIAYRVTFTIEWLIDLWSVLVMLYVWGTVYTSAATQIGGYDWPKMKTYLVVAHALNTFMATGVAWVVADAVKDGNIATDLTRPVNFLFAKLAEQFGGSLINGLIGGTLVVLLSVAFFGLLPPASVTATVLFLASALVGYVVNFFISYFLGLAACWLMNTQGLNWLVWFGGRLVAGTVIPITLFPGWLKNVAYLLPFHSSVADPLSIYLGQAQGADALFVIGVQLAWAAGLYLVARWVWPRAMKRLEIQGG